MFEWCGWYKPNLPNWLYPEQLVENGYPVDPTYTPFISARNLNPNESVEEYYNRCASLTKHVHRKHGADGKSSGKATLFSVTPPSPQHPLVDVAGPMMETSGQLMLTFEDNETRSVDITI